MSYLRPKSSSNNEPFQTSRTVECLSLSTPSLTLSILLSMRGEDRPFTEVNLSKHQPTVGGRVAPPFAFAHTFFTTTIG